LQISSIAAATSLRTAFGIFGVGYGGPQLCTCRRGSLVRRTASSASGKDPNHGSDGNGGYGAKLFFESEEVFMLQMVSPLILKLSLFLVTAVATHLVMSFGQTFLHYKVAHNPIGGKLFRNHINFHHAHYAEDHLVSRTYLGGEGNITPYFLIPVFLVGGCVYFLLPLNLFVVTAITSAASFYAHVFFDKEYHVEGSRLQRFAWFRRQQELHFVHHRHANTNFGIIHFFWDKILGTYRMPNAGA
jgi:sterol desaturase/sphingolipid hydroxylase (fatty acid hydroxylase superfamily)